MSRTDVIERVRAVLANVLNDSIRTWPADHPLSDVPGVAYDSVTRVETVAAIEDEFGLRVREVTPEDLATISAIVGLVTRNI
jgi:acyl carrier protein